MVRRRETRTLALVLTLGLGATLVAQPPNDRRDGARAIGGEGVFGFDLTFATTGTAPGAARTLFGRPGISKDVWFRWTAGRDGPVRMTTGGLTAVDTRLAVYATDADLPGAPRTLLAMNDDADGFQSTIDFEARRGAVYLVQVGTFPGAPGGPGAVRVGRPDVATSPDRDPYGDGTSDVNDLPEAMLAAD